MVKSDLLNFLKDINFMYNDCGMHDSVSKMLEDFEAEIRAKAYERFAEKLLVSAEQSSIRLIGYKADLITLDYLADLVTKLAEQLKEE